MTKKPVKSRKPRVAARKPARAKAASSAPLPVPPPIAPSVAPRPMVVREVAAAEFKDKCLELLDGVRDRRYEVVVTKHGKPTARIVAPQEPFVPLWGALKGMMRWEKDEDIIEPELDVWKDYL